MTIAGMLTPKQRAHLKSLAHHLKPIHHIGKEGLSEAGLSAIGDAFRGRAVEKLLFQVAVAVQEEPFDKEVRQRLPRAEPLGQIAGVLLEDFRERIVRLCR